MGSEASSNETLRDLLADLSVKRFQTLGLIYWGPTIDMLLLGIALSQFVLWLSLNGYGRKNIIAANGEKRQRGRDGLWISALVVWSCIGCIAHSAFVQTFGMTVFVYNYGDPQAIFREIWAKGALICELLLAGPVLVFYAARAYNLWNRSLILRCYLTAMILCWLALGIATTSLPLYEAFIQTLPPGHYTAWVSVRLVLALSLTVAIHWGLWRKRSGTPTGDRLVWQVIRLTTECQLIPCLFAFVLGMTVVFGKEIYVGLLFISLSKIWPITCMAVILSRRGMQREVERERKRRQLDLAHVPISFLGAPETTTMSRPIVLLSTDAGMDMRTDAELGLGSGFKGDLAGSKDRYAAEDKEDEALGAEGALDSAANTKGSLVVNLESSSIDGSKSTWITSTTTSHHSIPARNRRGLSRRASLPVVNTTNSKANADANFDLTLDFDSATVSAPALYPRERQMPKDRHRDPGTGRDMDDNVSALDRDRDRRQSERSIEFWEMLKQ